RAHEGARFDQYSLLSQAAAAGFGIALIPRCLIEDELRDGKLAVALRLPIRARQGYYLCYPEQKASLPILQAFRAWLMEVSAAAEPRPAEASASVRAASLSNGRHATCNTPPDFRASPPRSRRHVRRRRFVCFRLAAQAAGVRSHRPVHEELGRR